MENLEIKKILEKVFKRSIDVDTIYVKKNRGGYLVDFEFELSDSDDDCRSLIYDDLNKAKSDAARDIAYNLEFDYDGKKDLEKWLHRYSDESWFDSDGLEKFYRECVEEWVNGFNHEEIVEEMKRMNLIDKDDVEGDDFNFEEKVKEYTNLLYEQFDIRCLNEIWDQIGAYGEREDVYYALVKEYINFDKLAEIMIEEEDDSFLIDALDMSDEDEVEYNGKTYFVFIK